MNGDFSRDSFDPLRHFSRVLMQQGRLQLDADWNEQSDITLHFLRTLARDLIGEHGGPGTGFTVTELTDPKLDFAIAPGRYYVDGVLCENEAAVTYATQPTYRAPGDALQLNKKHLVYLDVWERHVTGYDDDSIREVALGSADTATRAQVVWQVRVTSKDPNGNDITGNENDDWAKWLKAADWNGKWVPQWQPANRGRLKARGKQESSAEPNPCTISPEARYRGLENQLYRVEIHTSGAPGKASFKWSRDNGSAVFPVTSLANQVAKLSQWGHDDRSSLSVGDWVELLDDDVVLRGQTGTLARVSALDPDERTVMLSLPTGITLPSYDAAAFAAKHVQLRRWDHKPPKTSADGAIQILDDGWMTLEDGVQVAFDKTATYRAGDYWLIPARTATGDVEWPGPVGQPQWRKPNGVTHYYAPLAIVGVGAAAVEWAKSFRRPIKSTTDE